MTYIFAEPVDRHLADGWIVTGEGISRELGIPEHRWYEMRWAPHSVG